MSDKITRRRALTVLGALPLAGAGVLAQQREHGQQAEPRQTKPKQTHEAPTQPAANTKPPPPSPPKAKFFTTRELRTLRRLADDVIPRDERSGSATEAGVIEFIDFNLSAEETDQDTRTAWRGGLRWLDTESRTRFGAPYAAATTAQRHAILDDISFPNGVPAGTPAGTPFGGIPPALRYGAAFFARARDMIAAGFFSSTMGFRDLRYIGNTALPAWNGCPDEALKKLGVSYD